MRTASPPTCSRTVANERVDPPTPVGTLDEQHRRASRRQRGGHRWPTSQLRRDVDRRESPDPGRSDVEVGPGHVEPRRRLPSEQLAPGEEDADPQVVPTARQREVVDLAAHLDLAVVGQVQVVAEEEDRRRRTLAAADAQPAGRLLGAAQDEGDLGGLLRAQQFTLDRRHPGLHEADDAVVVGGQLGDVLEGLAVGAEHVAHRTVLLGPSRRAATAPAR